jgi:uncharacterized protein
MSTTPAPREHTNIAPRWHSAALIALILAVALAGTILASRPSGVVAAPSSGAVSRILALYLPIIAVQWSLVLYTCRIGRARNELPYLLGVRWTRAGRAFTDVGLAVAGWFVIEGCERAWASIGGARASASTAAMLPHGWLERGAWIAVAISAGFCEEVVYRGYLQTQLGAFTRRPSAGVALQAVLFGIAHLEQGPSAATRMALYGLGFGVLAQWRRSLLPGILCHIGIDVVSGLLRR